MNVNNIIRDLRRNIKLQPFSVHCSTITPSIPATPEFFNTIIPTLKLILRAFKRAGFSHTLSQWGELTMFSQEMGLEVMLRIQPNTSYMSHISSQVLEKQGYQVVDAYTPRKPLTLRYFYCGTKSKWREIAFDFQVSTIDSAYINFIQPILCNSKPFRGRLKSPVIDQQFNESVAAEIITALARYADKHCTRAYGLRQINKLLLSEYIRDCFVGNYGVILLTGTFRRSHIIQWHEQDIKLLRKYFPEFLSQYEFKCLSIASEIILGDEHQFLLEVLDKALIKQFRSIEEAEQWLSQDKYITESMPPLSKLGNIEDINKIVNFVLNR